MKKLSLLFCFTLFLFSCQKTNTNPALLPDAYSDQGLGASAHDLLTADKYTSVTIQVQYMPGYRLDDDALSNLTTYLNTLCNKPGGINVTQTQVAANGDTLNPQKVAILEKQNRSLYTSGTNLAFYILVTDGVDTAINTLGFAYRNTSMCLFGNTIFSHSGSVGEPSRVSLESSVMEHEFGHILGLVNTGTPMVVNHEDPVHSKHCANPACLMYYAIDVHNPGSILHPNTIPVLDTSCRNDLHAYGGK